MVELAYEERVKRFAEMAARSGKIWAHPDSIAALRKMADDGHANAIATLAGIKLIASNFLAPGQFMTREPDSAN